MGRGQWGMFYPNSRWQSSIMTPERQRKVRRHEPGCGIWMGFGQLDQGKGIKAEAKTML